MNAVIQFPRLCRGLVLVPDGEALLVDGGLRRCRLTGKMATSLLPRVLPLLDGSRDTRSIAAAAGLDDAAVARLLGVLDDSDLLERTGHPAAAAPDLADHVTAYFSRTISAVGDVSCTEELTSALRGSAALLIADDPLAARIAGDLAETGVGEVRVRRAAQMAGNDLARLACSPRRLVAVLDDGSGDSQAVADAVTLTRGSGTPVLRFAGDADTTEIGPVFYDGWTACVRCFRSGYAAVGGGVSGAQAPSDVTAALVTAEIVATLAKIAVPSRPWQMTRTSTSGWRTERFDTTPAVGCEDHGSAASPPDTGPAGALALAYEWQYQIPPPALRAPRPVSARRQRGIAAQQHERDPFPPAPARELSGELGAGEALVAALLARTAGRRMPPAAGCAMDRWAPSGGNLGSVQLYVVTERDLFGLPGTLFRYDDLGHRVLPVRADRVSLDRVLSGADSAAGAGPAPPDAVLIFVASASRIGRKYDEFALRLSHLDAGCAALQLSAVAAARRVSVSFASAWSPGLASLLELEPEGEIVTALAVLGWSSQEGTARCR